MDKDLLKWFKARDFLLGLNYRQKNIYNALEIAQDCDHEDAKWLCSIFKNVNLSKTSLENVLKLHDDPRAWCFLIIVGSYNFDMLSKSAKAGYPLAQSIINIPNQPENYIENAKKYFEPFAFTGNYRMQALLGRFDAMWKYGMTYGSEDDNRFTWINRTCEIPVFVEKYYNEVKKSRSMRMAIQFGMSVSMLKSVAVKHLPYIELYSDWKINVKLQIYTWSIAGIRCGVCKDIRILIAKKMWTIVI